MTETRKAGKKLGTAMTMTTRKTRMKTSVIPGLEGSIRARRHRCRCMCMFGFRLMRRVVKGGFSSVGLQPVNGEDPASQKLSIISPSPPCSLHPFPPTSINAHAYISPLYSRRCAMLSLPVLADLLCPLSSTTIAAGLASQIHWPTSEIAAWDLISLTMCDSCSPPSPPTP
ncbi:hypothetical protein BDN67DRAFT_137112 [Paxillus ammoniavirescens]|nr:hypothetical protein BDN67DRAFT_137112 [Paxillus ammoniavirescens]